MMHDDMNTTVDSVDELIRLARSLRARRPGDPDVAAQLRRIAAARGDPLWQQIVEEVLQEPPPARDTRVRRWLRAADSFLRGRVWKPVTTRCGVAVVSAATAAAGTWLTAREAARPNPADFVHRSEADEILTDAGGEIILELFDTTGRPKDVTSGDVVRIVQKYRARLNSPAPSE